MLLEAIRIDHKRFEFQHALALAELQAGNKNKAIELLREVMEINPNDIKAILLFLKINDLSVDAEAIVKQHYKDAPDQYAAAYAISILKQYNGDIEAALLWIEHALQADANRPELITMKAQLLNQMAVDAAKREDWTTAQQWLKEAISTDNDAIQHLALSAIFYAKSGKLDNALAQADKIEAISAEKPNNDIALLKAEIFRIQEQPQRGLEMLQHYWQQQHAMKVLTRLVQWRKAYFPDTNPYTEVEAWQQEQETQESSRLLAIAYQIGNDNDKAIAHFQQLLKHYTDDYIAHNNLAWLVLNQYPKQALSHAESAYKLRPDSSIILDTYGWMLFKNQQTEKALMFLEKAYNQSQNNTEIAAHLATVYKANGNLKASDRLEQLLALKSQ